MTEQRRWTATIAISGETFAAGQSDSDLQTEQLKAAAREAGEILKAGLGDSALIRLLKTTQVHGTQNDIWANVWIGSDGRVRTQR